MKKYLSLLRGINVGGNNIIKMVDLKSCFESIGFANVQTYIQSGNVLFESEENDIEKLTSNVEKVLSERFNYSLKVVIVSQKQLEKIVRNAPQGFGIDMDSFRYDVYFLKEPLTVNEVIKYIKLKEGVDAIYPGDSVVYASKLISKASQSRLTKIISLPIYQNMTIRNWNTTTKLLEIMEK